MTTILGIKGIDPHTLESYVVLASDTQNTQSQGEIISSKNFDSEKIVLPQNSNYAYASCGSRLSYKNLPQEAWDNYDLISKPGSQNHIKNFEQILLQQLHRGKINVVKELNNSLKKNNRSTCEFIFSVNNTRNIKLYDVSSKGIVSEIRAFDSGYFINGSGSIFSEELLKSFLKKNKQEIPISDSVIMAYKAIKNAFADDYTGGNIDLSIILPEKMVCFRDIEEFMEKDPDFLSTIKERIDKPFYAENPSQAINYLKNIRGDLQKPLVKTVCEGNSDYAALNALRYVQENLQEPLVKIICEGNSDYYALSALKYVKESLQEPLVDIICRKNSDYNASIALKYVKESLQEPLVDIICEGESSYDASTALQNKLIVGSLRHKLMKLVA